MARVLTSEDGLVPADLFHSAHDHATASLELAQGSPSHLDSAGYLAHMAAELSLKAWLLHSAKQFKAIHSLASLYKELLENHGAPQLPAEHANLLGVLDEYGELRYPNRNSPTEVGQDDIDKLSGLIEFLHANYPAELQESIEGLDPLAKGGRVLMRKKAGL